ncbi:MAG: IPT/TIG domain-containing protein [Spirochaetales bacterium]|nr:IPT/TIG domain-containing protein [Spirochaetales bacterium]
MSTLVHLMVKNTFTKKPVDSGYLYIIRQKGSPYKIKIKDGKTLSPVACRQTYDMFYSSTQLDSKVPLIPEKFIQKVNIGPPRTKESLYEIYVNIFPVAYVKFEVWNQENNTYKPLPAGIEVLLMPKRYSRDELLKAQTDSNGSVVFNIESIAGELAKIKKPDVFFCAKTDNKKINNTILPKEWSTYGWKTPDNKPGNFGYAALYKGMGSESAPLIYRIGVDFHIRILSTPASANNPRRGLEDMPFSIWRGISALGKIYEGKLDSQGEVHGTFFDIKHDSTLYFRLHFELEDKTIHMNKAYAYVEHGKLVQDYIWDSLLPDQDGRLYSINGNSSFGTQSNPYIIPTSVPQRRGGFAILKYYKELSLFLYYMTNKTWKGFPSLKYRHSVGSFAAIKGVVHLETSDLRHRGTILHETAHQVMWHTLDISTLKILSEGAKPIGGIYRKHDRPSIYNPYHALIEGWADFFERIFDINPVLRNFHFKDDSSKAHLLQTYPANTGESVEGAVSSGLWRIYNRFVLLRNNPRASGITESTNGDITQNNPWIKDSSFIKRFMKIIWQPFTSLAPKSAPTSIDYFNAIRKANTEKWHEMVSELNELNMYLRTPKFARISPSQGPKAGGQKITISGDEFVDGRMEVHFILHKIVTAGIQRESYSKGKNVKVINSKTLTVITPAINISSAVDVRIIVISNIPEFTENFVVKKDAYTYT